MSSEQKLTKQTFIDGEFSMEINVSEEERTIYMSQKEIADLFKISVGTVSKAINNIAFQMGQFSENAIICKSWENHKTNYYSLEIIKVIGQKYNPERLEKLENWLYDLLPENNIDIIDGDYEIVRYNQDNLNMPVLYDPNNETPWLTQKQMSLLFGTSVPNISYHIANIFNEEELEENSVIKEYLTTADDGKNYKTILYNIDMIFAVGYRVKTTKAIKFRTWVTKISKQYLLNNYLKTYQTENNNYIINKVNELDQEISILKADMKDLKPNNMLFYKEQGFDAYIFLSVVIATALKEVFIIDPYADRFTISLLKIINDGINIVIVLSKKGKIDIEQLEIFKQSRPNVTIQLIVDNDEHDRHLFIDRKYGFIIGPSTNSFGYHDSSITRIDDSKYIKQKLNKYIKKDA